MPFPSSMHQGESESEVVQSCPTLSDPTDCSLPGSSIHGIFQAIVLEWGAITFSVNPIKLLSFFSPQSHFLLLYLIFMEKAMTTHSSTLAQKIPWAEGPGGLQSMGSLRVKHD